MVRRQAYDDKPLSELLDGVQQKAEQMMENSEGWRLITTDFREPGAC
jgi:hypothetical protein